MAYLQFPINSIGDKIKEFTQQVQLTRKQHAIRGVLKRECYPYSYCTSRLPFWCIANWDNLQRFL